MKKLALRLEELRVESFETTPGADAARRGTVRGHGMVPAGGVQPGDDDMSPLCVPSEWETCPDTCKASCGGTCDRSCEGSCNASCGGSCEYTCDGETCPAPCIGAAF